jgi:hypothetical protein
VTGVLDVIEGRVWVFGDDINTDLIIISPLQLAPVPEMAAMCFSAIRPGWVDEVRPGDIIVAGRNFAVGSGRAIGDVFRHLGISCIVADRPGPQPHPGHRAARSADPRRAAGDRRGRRGDPRAAGEGLPRSGLTGRSPRPMDRADRLGHAPCWIMVSARTDASSGAARRPLSGSASTCTGRTVGADEFVRAIWSVPA